MERSGESSARSFDEGCDRICRRTVRLQGEKEGVNALTVSPVLPEESTPLTDGSSSGCPSNEVERQSVESRGK